MQLHNWALLFRLIRFNNKMFLSDDDGAHDGDVHAHDYVRDDGDGGGDVRSGEPYELHIQALRKHNQLLQTLLLHALPHVP